MENTRKMTKVDAIKEASTDQVYEKQATDVVWIARNDIIDYLFIVFSNHIAPKEQ